MRRYLMIACFILGIAHSSYATFSLKLDEGNSTRICYRGDPVDVIFIVTNLETTPLNGILEVKRVDYWGNPWALHTKAVNMNAYSISSTQLQFNADRDGYFSYDIKLVSGEVSLVDNKNAWSLAVLDEPRNFPDNSRMGIGSIGNVGMLASIVPKGFFKNMEQMGAKWGAVDTWWKFIEPTKGTFDWDYYGKWFEQSISEGFVHIPHLFGTPEWASRYEEGDPTYGLTYEIYPPKNWEEWDQFVFEFVNHNKSWLKYIRIWNEPNVSFWAGTPEEYAQAVIVASQAAKRAKPDIKIIIEVVFCDLNYLEQVHRAGATPHWDVLGIHNYEFEKILPPERTNYIQNYQDMIEWKNEHNPEAEVWDTEYAWFAEPWPDPAAWVGVGETAQARYLARSHVLAFSLGLEKMFWSPGYSHALAGEDSNTAGPLRKNMSPRPCYLAYHSVASFLSSSTFEQDLTFASPECYGRVFSTPDGIVSAVWTIADGVVSDVTSEWVTLHFDGESSISVVNIMGEKEQHLLDSSGNVSLNLTPDTLFILSQSIPSVVNDSLSTSEVTIHLNAVTDMGNGWKRLTLRLNNETDEQKTYGLNMYRHRHGEDDANASLSVAAGQSQVWQCDIPVPSGNSLGQYSLRLDVDTGEGSMIHWPLALDLPIASPFWKATTGQYPIQTIASVNPEDRVEKAMLTFPRNTAYRYSLDYRFQGEPAWHSVAQNKYGMGTEIVDIGQENVDAVRISFFQNITYGGFEVGGGITEAQIWNKWQRIYNVSLNSANPHTGSYCAQLYAHGTNDYWLGSEIHQYLSFNPGTLYTLSCYSRWVDTSEWGQFSAIGTADPWYDLRCPVLLSDVKGQWKKIWTSFSPDNNLSNFRAAFELNTNGTVQLDDIFLIEGDLPSDIPEIISLDFVKPKVEISGIVNWALQ